MYDILLIDMFNMYYRNKNDLIDDPAEQAKHLIDFIKTSLINTCNKDYKVYFLYDPLIKSDMGLNKKYVDYKAATERRQLNSRYKSNRKVDTNLMVTMNYLKNYFKYRGENFITATCEYLEADDYVEKIVEREVDKKIAMYTSDSDWFRYLSDNCVALNKDLKHPYTKEKFIEEYGFTPTPTSVVMYKALRGDDSDSIQGTLYYPRTFYMIKDDDKETLIKNYVEEIKDEKIQDVMYRLEKVHSISKTIKKDLSNEERIYQLLSSSNNKVNLLFTTRTNIDLIRSRCKDLDKHLSAEPINEHQNKIAEMALGTAKKSKKFKFGGLKL